VNTPGREILDDVLTELRRRRTQLLAALTYIVLGAGAIYLFSSLGADSDEWYDTVDRTTLAGVGIGLLALAIMLGAGTLTVDRKLSQRQYGPTSTPRLRRGRVVAAMAVAAVLIGGGVVALRSWSAADEPLRLDQVAQAACGDDYDVRPAGELDPFIREGAGCDDVQVVLFDGRHGRDSFVQSATESGPVLVGSNWAVNAEVPVLRKAQAVIGGSIEGPSG
jgi:hypothetical protein